MHELALQQLDLRPPGFPEAESSEALLVAADWFEEAGDLRCSQACAKRAASFESRNSADQSPASFMRFALPRPKISRQLELDLSRFYDAVLGKETGEVEVRARNEFMIGQCATSIAAWLLFAGLKRYVIVLSRDQETSLRLARLMGDLVGGSNALALYPDFVPSEGMEPSDCVAQFYGGRHSFAMAHRELAGQQRRPQVIIQADARLSQNGLQNAAEQLLVTL